MTKLINFAFILIAGFATAQVSFSGKANLIFPASSPSWKHFTSTATNAYNEKGKNSVGFNVGLSAKVDLPTALFVMPEIYYTTFKNSLDVPGTDATLEAKSNRIDVPVLLGYNVLGNNLGVFVGPVASYNLSAKDEDFSNAGKFFEKAKSQFTVGYQFGAQAQIKKLIVNARYEGSFSKDQRDFIENVMDSGSVIRYDNRPSLLMLGVGYSF